MKILKRILLILFLLMTLAYIVNVTGLPDNIVLFKGEELNLGEMFGLYIKEGNIGEETIPTSTTLSDIEIVEKSTISLSLFNIIDVKEIEVNVIPKTNVVPLGNIIRT